MRLKWVPTTHMVADILTKSMTPTMPVLEFLRRGRLALQPTEDEQGQEDHRAQLRRDQRQRRKARMKGASAGSGPTGN